MIQPFDLATFNAYERLLALPDPPEMQGRRGHVRTVEGKPNRRQTIVPGMLTGWLQHHYLLVDGEEDPK